MISFVSRMRRFHLVQSFVRRAREAHARVIDGWLRIDTGPPDVSSTPPSAFDDAVAYDVIDYWLLRKLIAGIELSPADTVMDIGCGKGRALALYARKDLRKIVGVEYSPELAADARKNMKRLRGRKSPVEIIVADAVDADYSEGTVFFLYNPFGEKTLRAVLQRIALSLASKPRSVSMIYVNPLHEDVLSEFEGFRRIGEKRGRLRQIHAAYWVWE